MADNIEADAGSGGALFASAQGTWSGDATAQFPGCFLAIVSGSEGSWTFSQIVGGAGAVAAGVQRVTLASDDPAVVDLAAIEALLTTIDADTGTLAVVGGGVEATALRVTIASDSTGVLSVDDNGGSLTVDNAALSVTGGGVEASALRVTLASDSTGVLSIDDNGGSLTVDGTVAISGTVTVGSHAVTNAGTFAVQVDGNALTALQLIDDPVFADDAAFTLASSKVMMSGAIRDDSLSTLTAVEGDAVPLRVSSTGALHVTGGGGGTEYDEDAATPATITGTATMMERDDALGGLTPVEGDWAAMRCDANGALWVTVSGTVTVGSHAVTNAGTFAVQVDGAALTALQLIDNTVYVDDADWTATTSSHNLVGGVYQSTPGTITDGDTGPLRLTENGAAHVAVQNTVTVASHAVTNAGTFAVQVDGNALTALQLIDDPVFADDAAFTIGTSKVMMAGATVDEASTDSADEGDAVALRATATRQLVVTTKPTSAGEGCDIFRSIDLDETEEEVKASAGMLYGYYFTNLHATSARFLKFYNATAANVTVGTTTPILTLPLPAASAGHIAFPHPVKFDTALCAAATTAVADNDTGAPGANEVVLNVFYK